MGPFSTGIVNGISLVSIPGGTFQMGGAEDASEGDSHDKPVHTVTVSGFGMSEAEITNAQYCEWLNEALESGVVTVSGAVVRGARGAWSGYEYLHLSWFSGSSNNCWIRYADNGFSVEPGKENLPVVDVTWFGAKAFAEWYGLDLPCEEEWEYACRGGRLYEYGTDDGTIGAGKVNYDQNGPGRPVEVKSYPKNPFGLYDMSGNVFEWCAAREGRCAGMSRNGAQAGSEHVLRGGSWYNTAHYCRSSSRGDSLGDWGHDIGFRVVRRVLA